MRILQYYSAESEHVQSTPETAGTVCSKMKSIEGRREGSFIRLFVFYSPTVMRNGTLFVPYNRYDFGVFKKKK